jgi:IS5 family transposase
MRFLGVELGSKLPDENTIWDFKEAIRIQGLEKQLFELFNKTLATHGIAVSEGKIVDASFVEVPRRRVIKESEVKDAEKMLENENISITLGSPPEPEAEYIDVLPNDKKTKHILSQVDFDARFTQKGGQWYFGYKDHVVVCPVTKMIIGYDVTSAETPDCKVFLQFIDEKTVAVWADSAYMSEDIIKKLREINPDISIHIINRAYRNKPLTEEQKQENRLISKIRARCEHVFGYMTMSMAGMKLNCIGIDRARRDIGLKNLGYNLRRLVTLKRREAQPAPV